MWEGIILRHAMCIDICTINIRVSIRVRGLHLVFFGYISFISRIRRIPSIDPSEAPALASLWPMLPAARRRWHTGRIATCGSFSQSNVWNGKSQGFGVNFTDAFENQNFGSLSTTDSTKKINVVVTAIEIMYSLQHHNVQSKRAFLASSHMPSSPLMPERPRHWWTFCDRGPLDWYVLRTKP